MFSFEELMDAEELKEMVMEQANLKTEDEWVTFSVEHVWDPNPQKSFDEVLEWLYDCYESAKDNHFENQVDAMRDGD